MQEKLHQVTAWIKANKLTAVLIVIVAYFVFQSLDFNLYRSANRFASSTAEYAVGNSLIAEDMAMEISAKGMPIPPVNGGVAPRPDVEERKVITNASMSLKVKSVRDTMEIIKASVSEFDGYVVNSDLNSPELGESGNISVRIPSDKLENAMERFGALAEKVVSENVSGSDITDSYLDIEERLTRLESTKARFEEILDSAVEVQDILRVQREIFNLQDQIDSYKGRLQYMDAASATTLINIYLSTDELGLPYTPAQAWRPEAVFKQATRSLLMNLIDVGNGVIWVVVYIPAIIGLLVAFVLLKRAIRLFSRKENL